MLSSQKKKNKQVGGSHYQGRAFQPFDIIDEYELDFYEGNVLKYLLRYKQKGGLSDLKKAKHYLEIVTEKYESNYHRQQSFCEFG